MHKLILIIALSLLLCSCNSAIEPTVNTEAVTESAETPTEPTEPPKPEPEVIGDYILEGTTLIGYTGKDSALTLPDKVSAIAKDAFKSCPSPADITSLHLGAGVTEIEVGAFSALDGIESVTVDPYNPRFYIYEQAEHKPLLDIDGTAYYLGDPWYWNDWLLGIEEDAELAERVKRTVVGGLTVYVDIVEDRINIFSAEAFGQKVSFAEGLQVLGNHMVHAEDCEGGILFYLEAYTGNYWILTPAGICEVDGYDPSERAESYNRSTYFLFKREDGRIGYERCLDKYICHRPHKRQEVASELYYCVGRDEFCYEEGYVTCENGKVTFHKENTYTADEAFDLDEAFDELSEFYKDAKGLTIDEFLSKNAEKYDRGN